MLKKIDPDPMVDLQTAHWHQFCLLQSQKLESICQLINQEQLVILQPANFTLTHLPRRVETLLVSDKSQQIDICCQQLTALQPNGVNCLFISLGYTPTELDSLYQQAQVCLKPNGYFLIVHRHDPCFLWRLSSAWLRGTYRHCAITRLALAKVARQHSLMYVESVKFCTRHPMLSRYTSLNPKLRLTTGSHLKSSLLGQFSLSVLQKKQLSLRPHRSLKIVPMPRRLTPAA